MTDLVARGHALLNAIQALYDAGQWVLAVKLCQESILNLVEIVKLIVIAAPPAPSVAF